MIAASRQRSQASAKSGPDLYDAVIVLWLMTAILFPASYVGRTLDNRVRTYDGTGNLLTVTEPDASKAGKADVAYSCDAQNRLSTLTQEPLVTMYTYDLDGNILTKTLPNGNATNCCFASWVYLFIGGNEAGI